MIKRTTGELQALVLELRTMQQTTAFKSYTKELERLKSLVASGTWKDAGEGLAKSAGMIHGLDMALDIIDTLNSNLVNQLKKDN